MRSGPYLVGIAGPSCSGKSLLASALASARPGTRATVLSLDAYYRDLSEIPPGLREEKNFDVPEALDDALLMEHFLALASGREIERPVYDFASHTRLFSAERVEPGDLLIVEGLFVFHFEALRDLFGTRVFVEIPEEDLLSRRLQRDVRERGRTRESVLTQFEGSVRPMNRRYVLPTAVYAHVRINGADPLDLSVLKVLSHMEGARG